MKCEGLQFLPFILRCTEPAEVCPPQALVTPTLVSCILCTCLYSVERNGQWCSVLTSVSGLGRVAGFSVHSAFDLLL